LNVSPLEQAEIKVGSRYELVLLASKRAKQLQEGAPPLIRTAATNPLTIAIEEIAQGKVGPGAPEPEMLPIVPRRDDDLDSEGIDESILAAGAADDQESEEE
jgi:DNA-directed RNA polymerase subunit omega